MWSVLSHIGSKYTFPYPQKPPFNSAVLSSLSFNHLSNIARSLGLNPTLKYFGSIVKLVGILFASRQSITGSSLLSTGGVNLNAEMSLTNAVYSSRFAR
jgi:hypothetical protein